MTYDPAAIAAHFDQLGPREWDRFDRTLGDRVSLALHSRVLEQFIPRRGRVLEIGAGPGRFTEQLDALGCRITVGDISTEQLRLNEETARLRGFRASIDGWRQLDICDLGQFPDATFDAVVAFGGLLSYVFDRREQALTECLRVLRPGGVFLLSVMSLWGTLHRHLGAALALPEKANRSIIATGDLTQENDPTSTHHCHMFRAAEFRTFLARPSLDLLWLSASSAITTGLDPAALPTERSWKLVLEVEAAACTEAAYLDAGTHLIAAVRRTHTHTKVNMHRTLIVIAALAAGTPHAHLTAQRPQTLRQALIGTWRLVAARQRLTDGSVRPDPQTGAHGVGYIMYDATGHMCVVLANPDRPAWKAPKSPTDAELRSAFEGLVAYCGAYETNEAKHYVIHHIEADREPAVMGTTRTRLATVTATRLVLRPLDLPAGVAEWTVEFERVGDGTPASRRP